jgi:hypothetical protein
MLGYATREVFSQPISDILIGADNLVPALQTACGIATPNLGDVHLIRRWRRFPGSYSDLAFDGFRIILWCYYPAA